MEIDETFFALRTLFRDERVFSLAARPERQLAVPSPATRPFPAFRGRKGAVTLDVKRWPSLEDAYWARHSIPGQHLLHFAGNRWSHLTRMKKMTRKETLRLLVNHAQCNGFDFPRWFQMHIRLEWPGTELALRLLALESRHFTLLFSHEFVRCYWRTGSKMSFAVPALTYTRLNAEGEIEEVTRKPFTRRTTKPDVWKYHLSRMATADDALQYIGKFLPVQQQAEVREIAPPRNPIPSAKAQAPRLQIYAR
jgi:hypothetical protein